MSHCLTCLARVILGNHIFSTVPQNEENVCMSSEQNNQSLSHKITCSEELEGTFSHELAFDAKMMSRKTKQPSPFWVTVYQKQMGVKSERAMKYVGAESYPHLVQFARTPQDKRDLKQFLEIENEESSFQRQRECQREYLKIRQKDMSQMIQELDTLQKNGKYRHNIEVQQMESDIRENLHVSSDFWPHKTTTLKEIICQLKAFQLNVKMKWQNKEQNDALVVSTASNACALRGILLTREVDDQLQERQILLKAPDNICLMAPSHTQHVTTKWFQSRNAEKVFTNTVNTLGYSVEGFSMVDYMRDPSEMPSVYCHTKAEDHSSIQAYCSTVQYFIMPLASCWFSDDQLQLSHEAIEDLKAIENLIDSESIGSNSLQAKFEEFFRRFGSHASKGPFHFGGTYKWTVHSSNFGLSDTETVQQLQSEILKTYSGKYIFKLAKSVRHREKHDGKCSDTIMNKTFMMIATSGGPQGVIGLPGWKIGLVANNNTWSLIDRGTTLVPVWDIVRSNHKGEFEKLTSLAASMKKAWSTMIQCCPEQDMQDPVGHIANVTRTITSWHNSPNMQQCKEWLDYLGRIKQEVAQESMNPLVWPNVYLSQPVIQKALQLVVDKSIQCSSSESKSRAEVRKAVKEVVDPLDLDAVKDSSWTKNISMCVYSTDTSPVVMDCENMLMLHKFFQYALEYMRGRTEKDNSLIAIQPATSVRATTALAKAIWCFTNHLRKTGQKYEETFLVTMLLPFNYDSDQRVFTTSLSLCDLEYLCENFSRYCKEFFDVMRQQNIVKSQTHYFSLALEMHKDLCTSNPGLRLCLKCIEQRMGKDIDPCIAEVLHDLLSNHHEWEWLQPQLEFIKRKQEFEQFLSVLGLTDFYPQKLTLRHALEIRKDTLGNVKHLQGACSNTADDKNVLKNTQCTDPKLYPFLVLQQIMAFNFRCRTKLVLTSDLNSTSLKMLGVGKNVTEHVIHPMDGLLAVLYCADDFLRQDLMSRLVICQLAVPLLLPDPFEPQKLTFPMWALRSIVREWQIPNGTSREGQLATYPSPLVSFLRIGKLHMSKSHTLNTVISESGHSIFFHYNSDGGSAKHLLVNGIVEVCWYLPSKNETIFSDLVTFANLHGDARECPKQVQFLSKVSFMNFVFISGDNLNDEVLKVLETLAAAPGGLVLLVTESFDDDDDWWHERLEPNKDSIKTINLEHRNEAEITRLVRERMKIKLTEKWYDAPKHVSLESHSDTASLCNIYVDENEEHCMRGKELANGFHRFLNECRKTKSAENLKHLLSLQGPKLWQEWALAEKEQYRQTQRQQCDVETYVQQQRAKMEKIRKEQLNQIQALPSFMDSFLNSILTHQGKTRQYFLRWVRLLLDNLAREQLSLLNMQYKQSVSQLQRIQSQEKRDEGAELVQKNMIQRLNNKIIDASFGLENLSREVSQIYEAVAAQKQESVSQTNMRILHLPEVAAKLLIEGYPLELMDGDAAHVPTSWVSAVLTEVQELLHKPRVFVLSVLGVQSSGKSTLLNTVFGVRFSASAGRCTRGAFMQLLPIHKSFQHECKCDYFLIVDTEGLRAPELEQQTHRHDNQLATFAIGLAHLTIINLSGETIGDMDDILQTAVHAFLRMKKVELKPSCHFVHQNVTAVTAEEKARAGRLKFTKKLDEITRAAAKQEEKEDQYTCFKDLIDFDSEKHVFYFQNLWKGDPPMAPVNPGYSTSAQFLKLSLITYANQACSTQLNIFQKHLKELWKAILHENFVFSFKNTLEVMAYNSLDNAYSDWSWRFKQEMMTWEHTTHNRMRSCEMSLLPTVYEECRSQLPNYVQNIYQNLKEQMDEFFKNNPQREIVVKWKGDTANRLDNLMRQLKQKAENHCKFWKTNREDLAKIDEMKETHRTLILDQVKLLASQLEKGKLSDKQLDEQFNMKWSEWIKDIRFQRMDDINVKGDVEQCLTTFELLRPSLPMVLTKIRSKSLEKRGSTLQLVVENEHVKPTPKYVPILKVQWRSEWPLEDGQDIADKLFISQSGYLEQMKQKPYHSDLASHLLHKLFEDLSSHHGKVVTFTEEFKVDMALIVCGYAIKIFQVMVDTERRENDPVAYMERRMKGLLLKIFKDEYNQTAREVTAASAVCDLLRHAVIKEIFASLSPKIADGMRHAYPFLKNKPSLKAQILLDIGDKLDEHGAGGFEDCLLYIKNVEWSLHTWLERYTIQYCHEDKFTETANAEVLKNMRLITDTVSRVSMEFQHKAGEFQISEWLKSFHSGIQSTGILLMDAAELQQLAGGYELKDVTRFTTEVMTGLRVLECTLKRELENLSQKEISNWKVKPQDHLFEAVAGCIEQCPFCKEQCDLTHSNHCPSPKHSVALHRPKCLGRYRYHRSKEMVLEICTTAVGTDRKFRNCETGREFHPFKEYAKIYQHWSITADLSAEASQYWKWLLGHYADEIADAFSMKKTTIPTEWTRLKWNDVKKSLKDSFNL